MKKNKIINMLLIGHLLFSILVVLSMVIHCRIKKPFQDFIALNNPKKYIKRDTILIDTIIIKDTSINGRSNNFQTIIKGKLLSSKIETQIIYPNRDFIEKDLSFKVTVKNKKIKCLEVLRNILNNNVYLDNPKFTNSDKVSALVNIYFICTLFPLIIIIFLKNKKK